MEHVLLEHITLCRLTKASISNVHGLSGSLGCRLWAHEALRIFHDRLVSDDDRRWFANFLKVSVQEHLKLPFDDVFAPPGRLPGTSVDVLSATRSLLYCDFLTQVSHSAVVSDCWNM